MKESTTEAAIRQQYGGYLHGEAFALMKYATRDGREVEYIWNSRDGVTPFIVHARSGAAMQHVGWQHDRRIPDYEPQIGERIFVDLTPMRAQLIAREMVDRDWDRFAAEFRAHVSKEEAMERFAAAFLAEPGRPDLIEVRP